MSNIVKTLLIKEKDNGMESHIVDGTIQYNLLLILKAP
jgi:hypothetical protein